MFSFSNAAFNQGRGLFEGGVYFEITFLNHWQQLLYIFDKYYVI